MIPVNLDRFLIQEGVILPDKILAQRIVEMEQSPSFTELKKIKTKQHKQVKINDKIERCFRAIMTPLIF